LRYNRLIAVVRTSLVNVGKAIKGEVPLSVELEDICAGLIKNVVPEAWHARGF